jgi:hypothetical protein
MGAQSKILSKNDSQALLEILKNRFESNKNRHETLEWSVIEKKLETKPDKLWSLHEMERTGGEPDVIRYDTIKDEYSFVDCSDESPANRRSFCYDSEALAARKENKPKNSAVAMANEMGIEILNEADYHELQKLGNFDNKTSSWLQTPKSIRALGGAVFGDFRYGRVFIYHNGAESYYAARGFRGILNV